MTAAVLARAYPGLVATFIFAAPRSTKFFLSADFADGRGYLRVRGTGPSARIRVIRGFLILFSPCTSTICGSPRFHPLPHWCSKAQLHKPAVAGVGDVDAGLAVD